MCKHIFFQRKKVQLFNRRIAVELFPLELHRSNLKYCSYCFGVMNMKMVAMEFSILANSTHQQFHPGQTVPLYWDRTV